MLTKPLAYKGPNNHLSQHFDMENLYQGVKLLLDDMLMDYQLIKTENRIQGMFLYQQKLAKTSLAWPLKANHIDNFCSCKQFEKNKNLDSNNQLCDHLAALAIESKVQLDKLPPPLKQQEVFSSEQAYLKDWFNHQTHDPFPAMARHRVVYILNQENGHFFLSVHKAYLTQQQSYQLKAPLPLNISIANKLPKFVSLTDQEILLEIQSIIKAEPALKITDNQFQLIGNQIDNENTYNLITKLALSERLFWRSCHRHPLRLKQVSSTKSLWQPISANHYLDQNKTHIYYAKSLSHDQLALLKWVNKTSTSKSLLAANLIKPKLTIQTQQMSFAWQPSSLFEFDCAQISFAFFVPENKAPMVELNFDEIEHLLASDKQKYNVEVLEYIAAKLHLIDSLESIGKNFQPFISSQFDSTSRYFSGDFSHWFPLIRGLQLEGFNIEFAPNFKFNQVQVDDWYSQVSYSQMSLPNSDNFEKNLDGWFELEVGVKVEGESVNILPFIVQAFKQGQLNLASNNEHIPITLDNGRIIAIQQKRVQAIVDTLVELSESEPLIKQKLVLPESQLMSVKLLEDKMAQSATWLNSSKLQKKAQALANSRGVESVVIPNNIKAKLRGYQKFGVDWLQFLARENIAGILADDMGLGKTLQTLCHIQIEKNAHRAIGPSLVVAPTSLLGNWLNEAQKFTPELKLISWSGNKRHIQATQLASSDLIVTSYGVLARDFSLFNKLSLHLLILDEAQTIKNASAKISKVAYAMKAKHKLCLTGTPLENHLGELWSLFHFLMPGMLGNKAQFKRLFQIPIEKEQDIIKQQQLAQRIAPFMLRRTKDKVASDLPAKTQIDEVIELSQTQADLYETVRLSMLEEVQKAILQSGSNKNQLLIGNALLRLRQICCHPHLVEFGQNTADDSAKLNWLLDRLPKLIESGRRILVFSSFTQMLEKISQALSRDLIKHLTLTGKTTNRTKLVEQFQNGDFSVFLISLKAGGAGLNLTAADTVIHFDPWWNPAAEEQASDRAHRIGQDKPVFIYKLIAKGTVEEKIYQMQQQKSQLADDIYRQNEAFNRQQKPDWEALLAPIETLDDIH